MGADVDCDVCVAVGANVAVGCDEGVAVTVAVGTRVDLGAAVAVMGSCVGKTAAPVLALASVSSTGEGNTAAPPPLGVWNVIGKAGAPSLAGTSVGEGGTARTPVESLAVFALAAGAAYCWRVIVSVASAVRPCFSDEVGAATTLPAGRLSSGEAGGWIASD